MAPQTVTEPGDATTLGGYIRQRRIALDITKSEAARRAGVSRRTWHEVEEGQRTNSTALTLAQFDQALGLDEGTLYAMTSRSASQEVESLRQRAIALVKSMTTEELAAFVESNGAHSIRDMFDQLRSDIAELRGDRPAGRRPSRSTG